MKLEEAAARLEAFGGLKLRDRIAGIESSVRGASGPDLAGVLAADGVTTDLLEAAVILKRVAGQINVVVHTIGILIALPEILEPGETIEYVSLGAGNTGRKFDLETDRRVAEFKFITWRGGPEAIRQNSLFKDFYGLAEHPTPKRRQLFVTGDELPLKFLRGRRALASILSRHNRTWEDFRSRYGDRYLRVNEYYADFAHLVEIVDLSRVVPAHFLSLVAAADTDAPNAAAEER